MELGAMRKMGILGSVNAKISATDLAHDSKAILDRVIIRGETVEIQRHGKTVAEIQPKVGVSKEEFEGILGRIHWTEAESGELRKAMETATKVFGCAGRD